MKAWEALKDFLQVTVLLIPLMLCGLLFLPRYVAPLPPTGGEALRSYTRLGKSFDHEVSVECTLSSLTLRVITDTLIDENRYASFYLSCVREGADGESVAGSGSVLAAVGCPDEIFYVHDFDTELKHTSDTPPVARANERDISYLSGNNFEDMVRIVTLHEVGHLRWFQGVSERLEGFEGYPCCTKYAESGLDEKFAEYYALYRFNPELLAEWVGTATEKRFERALKGALKQQSN